MKILELATKIAFKEVFETYRLPYVVDTKVDGETEIKTLKTFEEWRDEIELDCIGYSYQKGELCLLKDNSLTDILLFFNEPLLEIYDEKVEKYYASLSNLSPEEETAADEQEQMVYNIDLSEDKKNSEN
ncbi:MAG: hypothetical protein J6T10_05455 [Methanobrevibacter sp.]|nr:hypothetical protein [Methanobrevibacter sp.]